MPNYMIMCILRYTVPYIKIMDCKGVLYIFKYYHTRFAYNMQIGKTSIGTKLITEYYICIHLWAYYLFVVIFNENCVLQNDLVVFVCC